MKSQNETAKKFSLGVSFGQISPNEFCIILERYSRYIHDVFFSPTDGLRFLTRYRIYDMSNTSNDERIQSLNQVLFLAKKLDIKISLTLNSPSLETEEAVAAYKKYAAMFPIDYVTTTYKIGSAIRKTDNVNLICSYNEAITNYDHLNYVVNSGLFNGIVLGNLFIRDPKAFGIIRKKNLDSILLLNNGCTWECASFCKVNSTHYCHDHFYQELSKTSLDELYARQSIFPEELIEYEKKKFGIKIYKLSSRPITFNELNNLLSSYISGESRTYISRSIANYHLYARLGHFGKFYSELNYENILEFKRKYWEDIPLF